MGIRHSALREPPQTDGSGTRSGRLSSLPSSRWLVSELRSELPDDRKRRIHRRQETHALALVLLGVAIGIGALWIYAKLRYIAG